MELTLDQRRAIAVARAKKAQAESVRAPELMPVEPVAAPEQPNRWNNAAEAIANDLSAGVQGVNPVATGEALNRQQAVGMVVNQPGMEPYVSEIDGRPYVPLSEFPADKFVTHSEGGQTYIIPRTATDSAGKPIEEGRLSSAGRLAGYGVISNFGNVAKEASKSVQMSKAADDVGVTPSLAMRGPIAGRVAAAGESTLPTSGPFLRDSERVTEEIAGAATKLADMAGAGVTPYQAGKALQEGGETFVTGARSVQGRLFDAVDKAIAPNRRISSPETVAFLEKEVAKLAELPNISKTLGNGTLDGWLADLKSGNLTWEAARQLRSDIGNAIGKISGPGSDMAQGRLKAIYGKLTDDLGEAAKAAGPEAAQAWNRAQVYTRVSEGRIDQAFKRILGKNTTPEQAYSIFTGMASETSRANADALKRVLRSLPKDEAATVASTVIRRMGDATNAVQNAAGDVFSASTFLTNWNKMAPESRAAIANAGLDKGVADGLTKLAKVIEAKKAADALRNTSKTAPHAITAALGAAAYAEPVTAVSAFLASNVGARALTSRRFLAAVNRFVATGKPDALKAIAKSSAPGAIEAATILRLQAEPALSAP